jgi:transcriptional regulator with XRE-family HTH domain
MRSTSNLFDQIIKDNNLANDVELARELGLFPSNISRIRKEKLSIGSTLLIAIHERFEIPVATIRELAGMGKYVRPEAGARVQFKRAQASQ